VRFVTPLITVEATPEAAAVCCSAACIAFCIAVSRPDKSGLFGCTIIRKSLVIRCVTTRTTCISSMLVRRTSSILKYRLIAMPTAESTRTDSDKARISSSSVTAERRARTQQPAANLLPDNRD
jgi:hypothetical protein